MWDIVRLSTGKRGGGPGKRGVRIEEHFGSVDGARAHLAASKAERLLLSKQKLSAKEARRSRDQRRDFMCFMPDCGLCFERADKLERHLLETKVHKTNNRKSFGVTASYV